MTMRSCRPRVDYDEIAAGYDAQPYRERSADRELMAFAEPRALTDPAVLDIGCGTGNQLIANRAALPESRLVGLDRSSGMLRQARRKAPDIGWVQGDGATLPFPPESFDFVCCQFAFHHIADKEDMLRSVLAVLRSGGRFAMRNLCPQRAEDWLCYEYFPDARAVDLRDFWPPEEIVAAMEAIGFRAVRTAFEHIRFEQDLRAWLETIRRRDTCSQLQAISDTAFRAGVARLQREAADPAAPRSRPDHLCLMTILGEAGAGI